MGEYSEAMLSDLGTTVFEKNSVSRAAPDIIDNPTSSNKYFNTTPATGTTEIISVIRRCTIAGNSLQVSSIQNRGVTRWLNGLVLVLYLVCPTSKLT